MTPKDYAILAQKCYTDPPTFGREDSAARAVVYGDVEAFPGTNNLACVRTDIEIESVGVPGMGRLHQGFWNAYQSLASQLADRCPKGVTGHSEGGALAVIRAAALCLAGTPPKELRVFEPPRVSQDDTLRKLFIAHGVDVLFTRKGNDIVPMFPNLPDIWQHSADLTPIGKAIHWFDNVDDHAMQGVIDAL